MHRLPILLLCALFLLSCSSCMHSSQEMIDAFEKNRELYEELSTVSKIDLHSSSPGDENLAPLGEIAKTLGLKSFGPRGQCGAQIVTQEARIRKTSFVLVSGYIFSCDGTPPEYGVEVDNIDTYMWASPPDPEVVEMIYQQIDEHWFLFIEKYSR